MPRSSAPPPSWRQTADPYEPAGIPPCRLPFAGSARIRLGTSGRSPRTQASHDHAVRPPRIVLSSSRAPVVHRSSDLLSVKLLYPGHVPGGSTGVHWRTTGNPHYPQLMSCRYTSSVCGEASLVLLLTRAQRACVATREACSGPEWVNALNRCCDNRCADGVVLEVNVAIATSGSSRAFDLSIIM